MLLPDSKRLYFHSKYTCEISIRHFSVRFSVEIVIWFSLVLGSVLLTEVIRSSKFSAYLKKCFSLPRCDSGIFQGVPVSVKISEMRQ